MQGQGRGVRVMQCTRCGYALLPYQVTAERARVRRASRIAPLTRRRLRIDSAPSVPPPPRRWQSEGKDMSVPRGERD